MRSVRVRFTKTGSSKYISHLDLTRFLLRAFRRTDIPIWYTEGFNPHPYIVFGLSLPLGVEGVNEVFDFRLDDDNYPTDSICNKLNDVSVDGIRFISVSEPKYKPIDIKSASYTVTVPFESENAAEEFRTKIDSAVDSGEIMIEKKTKKGEIKQINVCEHLKSYQCHKEKNSVIIGFHLPAGNELTVNPVPFCNALFSKVGKKDILHRIVRNELFVDGGDVYK